MDDDDISDSEDEEENIDIPDEDYDSMPELIDASDASDEIVREPRDQVVRRVTSIRV